MFSRLFRSVLILMLVATFPAIAKGQSCNPAVVSYLVRDETGARLSQAELEVVRGSLPEAVGDARVNTVEVSFTEDQLTYYWPESVDWPKGKKQPALEFANAAKCTMSLSEIALTYHGKKMRLLFNLSIDRTQRDRRIVIDSIPFQEGTFELDLTAWSRDPERMIPAEKWRKAATK